MKLKEIHVERLGCLESITLPLSPATALIGRNGAGKSTILRALKIFYGNSASTLTKEDFFDGDDDQPIVIRLTWCDLPDEASERFKSYVSDEQLTVAYVVEADERGRIKGTYRGYRLQHRPFYEIRSLTGAREQTNAFGELIEGNDLYEGLTKERGAPANLSQMDQWEAEHPEHCEAIEAETQFFGIAGGGYLNDYTSFIYVPAVREASHEGDETGDKSSGLKALMDRLVHETIMQDEQAKQNLEQIETLTEEIYGDKTHPRLDQLSNNLSEKIHRLAPGSKLELQWAAAPKTTLRAPSASVFLTEDGYPAPLDHVGHGLQRAYILSVLQELSEVNDGATNGRSSVVLGIEEPELYQHPNRQRHLADVLRTLSNDRPGFQVAYTTHSPLFVSVADFSSVRRLTKVTTSSPARSEVHSSTLTLVAQQLGKIEGTALTSDRLYARLRDVIRPWISEGFFADGVVLVEGGSDRAALIGLAQVREEGFARHGISILPVGGKNNLLACALIFRSLGIETFTVWDCDHPGAEPEDDTSEDWRKWKDRRDYSSKVNKRLFDLHDADGTELFRDEVLGHHACFCTDLETALKEDWSTGDDSDAFLTYRNTAAREIGVESYKSLEKNPSIMRRMIGLSIENGTTSTRLVSIYDAIRDTFGL